MADEREEQIKKQRREKVANRVSALRCELQESFGQALSNELLVTYVHEEVARRVKATVEAALRDFESGEELLALKEFAQEQASPPRKVEPAPAIAEVVVDRAALGASKKDFRKFKKDLK